MTLSAQQTVIEVLETVSPDEKVLAGCRRLVAAGFRLALDDFVWFDGADRLLRLASTVKIDIQLMSPAEVVRLYRRCRAYGVQVLAEKVETEEELERCKLLGFDLFQGYALGYPRSFSGRVLDASAVLLSAFDLLMNMTPDEVVDARDLDPQLSAAAFGDTSPMGRLVREVIAHEMGMSDRGRSTIDRAASTPLRLGPMPGRSRPRGRWPRPDAQVQLTR